MYQPFERKNCTAQANTGKGVGKPKKYSTNNDNGLKDSEQNTKGQGGFIKVRVPCFERKRSAKFKHCASNEV
jgi:hypothetical protein